MEAPKVNSSSSSLQANRIGICCAGNWIIDHVKTVNTWPAEETLADIEAEHLGTGGSPYNVCIDLKRFGATFPIMGLGLIGDDEDGTYIRTEMEQLQVDTKHLLTINDVPTAYTDVITVKATGRRTFFHQRGANALFSPEHIPVADLNCRILSLGYLLLLDGMDAPHPTFGTMAAKVLAECRTAGILTSVDLVSEDSDRFRQIVEPALPHTDYLIINEIEAERTTGITVRSNGKLLQDALAEAATDLLGRGVGQLVVLHAPEGAMALPRGGQAIWVPSLNLPDGFIQGAAGAGDAFFAGMLFGLYEAWPLQRTLTFAHGAAATSLRHPTCTGGVGTMSEIEDLCVRFTGHM